MDMGIVPRAKCWNHPSSNNLHKFGTHCIETKKKFQRKSECCISLLILRPSETHGNSIYFFTVGSFQDSMVVFACTVISVRSETGFNNCKRKLAMFCIQIRRILKSIAIFKIL